MLSVVEAVARVTADITPLPPERIPLLESVGRVLAEPGVARYTMPPWNNSAMDGYAVRSADVLGASAASTVRLKVLETVVAGAFPTVSVVPGHATRIMTGAPVPDGADCVIRVEDTDDGRDWVTIRDSRDRGKNVRPRGEDFVAGAEVLERGTPIGAAQIGTLATLGYGRVLVHRRPRVATLGSGNELVDLDRFHEVLAGQRIVSSNSYTVAALISANGGVPVSLGDAADEPEALRELLQRARGSDLIVTTAGASVGEFDYTRGVLASLGATINFWRVRMRPGAPFGFGTIDGIPWISLPGNPVSAMVTFELFVRPVLRAMLGHRRLHRRPVPVVLEEPVALQARLTHFLRGVVHVRPDGRLGARLTGPQGSGILTSMSRANALLIVPEDTTGVDAGATVHALLLSEDAQLSDDFQL